MDKICHHYGTTQKDVRVNKVKHTDDQKRNNEVLSAVLQRFVLAPLSPYTSDRCLVRVIVPVLLQHLMNLATLALVATCPSSARFCTISRKLLPEQR